MCRTDGPQKHAATTLAAHPLPVKCVARSTSGWGQRGLTEQLCMGQQEHLVSSPATCSRQLPQPATLLHCSEHLTHHLLEQEKNGSRLSSENSCVRPAHHQPGCKPGQAAPTQRMLRSHVCAQCTMDLYREYRTPDQLRQHPPRGSPGTHSCARPPPSTPCASPASETPAQPGHQDFVS